MSGSTNNSTIIGSGSDSITLNIAEDQAQGVDARFTVNVDGQQVGGVQTATAAQSSGQTNTFTFNGDWAPGQHNVTVTFANNFLYPGTAGDRNLYVDGVTYDGQTVSNTTTPIYQSPLFPPNSNQGNVYGNATFAVNDTTALPAGFTGNPTSTPAPVTVGSGADTLVLNMAEDPYLGDAQFTVSVDGQQVGGVQTTTAVVGEGQSQEFDVKGNFGSGTHNVAVTFLNDKVGGYYPAGTPGLPATGQWALDTADRNLYVMGMSLDGGAPAAGAPWELSSDGTQTFSVTAGTNPAATGAGSGLFASDGAAATGNNAAITPASLTAGTTTSGFGTSTGTSTGGSTGGSAGAPPGGSTGGSTGATVGTTPAVAAGVSGSAPSTQDFSVPAAANTGTTTGTTSGTTPGNSAALWSSQQSTYVSGATHHHHS